MSVALAATAAFVAGLAASAHCLAMCGAISVTLARTSPAQATYVLARQMGRVAAYTLAGAVVGALGQTLLMVGDFPSLRIALQLAFAASWLWLALRLLKPQLRFALGARMANRIWALLQPLTRHLLPANTFWRAFALGGLWGFMPCGLSYAMLLIAATQGSLMGGAAIMAAFGLATTFALAALDLGSRRLEAPQLLPWVRYSGAALAITLAALALWWPFAHRGHDHGALIQAALVGDDYCVK